MIVFMRFTMESSRWRCLRSGTFCRSSGTSGGFR